MKREEEREEEKGAEEIKQKEERSGILTISKEQQGKGDREKEFHEFLSKISSSLRELMEQAEGERMFAIKVRLSQEVEELPQCFKERSRWRTIPIVMGIADAECIIRLASLSFVAEISEESSIEPASYGGEELQEGEEGGG